jgi:hypothetical protein
MSKLQIDENELRKHDHALAAALDYFNGLIPHVQKDAQVEFKARWGQLEMAYLELMDVVIEEAELPEEWE